MQLSNMSYFSKNNCMGHEENLSSISVTKSWTSGVWLVFKGFSAPGGVDRAGSGGLHLQEGERDGDEEGAEICPHNSLIVASSM